MLYHYKLFLASLAYIIRLNQQVVIIAMLKEGKQNKKLELLLYASKWTISQKHFQYFVHQAIVALSTFKKIEGTDVQFRIWVQQNPVAFGWILYLSVFVLNWDGTTILGTGLDESNSFFLDLYFHRKIHYIYRHLTANRIPKTSYVFDVKIRNP